MGKGVQRLGSNLGQVASQFTAKGKQGSSVNKLSENVQGTSKSKQGQSVAKLSQVTQFKEGEPGK